MHLGCTQGQADFLQRLASIHREQQANNVRVMKTLLGIAEGTQSKLRIYNVLTARLNLLNLMHDYITWNRRINFDND